MKQLLALIQVKKLIALDVTPAQGLFRPRWDGTQWVEDRTPEEIEALKAQAIPTEPTPEEIEALKAQAIPTEPTLEERVDLHDTKIVTLEETIDVLYGGV